MLDLLQDRGILWQIDTTNVNSGNGKDAALPQSKTPRQYILEELVTTERDYVQHLETLQDFKKFLEQKGALPGDAIHDIFLNLNSLLDFQRRFLSRMEQQDALPEDRQDWGKLFISSADGFAVYEPFVANQRLCFAVVSRDFKKIYAASINGPLQQMVSNEAIFTSFLLKPFQRMTKYPQLLRVSWRLSCS